jgi:hypothetical protein
MSIPISIVSIFNLDFGQIFPEVQYFTVVVEENSRTFEHPLEDGSSVVDHSIILPVRINLKAFLGFNVYFSTYNRLRAIYLARSTIFVKTRTSIYQNMIIEKMPHEETNKAMESISINLILKEIQVAQTQTTFSPTDNVDSSTVARGRQTTTVTTPPLL